MPLCHTGPGTASRNTSHLAFLGEGEMEGQVEGMRTSRLHHYIKDPTDVPGQPAPALRRERERETEREREGRNELHNGTCPQQNITVF